MKFFQGFIKSVPDLRRESELSEKRIQCNPSDFLVFHRAFSLPVPVSKASFQDEHECWALYRHFIVVEYYMTVGCALS